MTWLLLIQHRTLFQVMCAAHAAMIDSETKNQDIYVEFDASNDVGGESFSDQSVHTTEVLYIRTVLSLC